IGEPTFANPLATYSSGDANALNTGGFNVRYLNQTATNKPTGTDHAVMTLNYSNIWSVQQAFDWRTGDVFTRNQNNGTWLSWATQVDTRNFASTIPTFSVSNPGLVPARVGSTTTKFLREDGTWVVPTDTTYAEMTEANAIAGTETTARLITAAVLKSAIQTHAPTPTNISGNAGTATKLATARTINGVAFDGTANITIADSTKVPLSGGTMTGNLNANALGVNNNSNSSGLGVSLYAGATGGMPSYGLAFSGTATFGTHGSVVGDWATYFTMSGATNRGWIFKSGNGAGGNVASISANGIITGNQFKLTAIGDANYIANGNGDAASYSSHNMIIRSWWGIGFRDNADVCRTVLDTRTGNFSTQGTIAAASVVASGSVQVGGAIQSTAAVSFLNGSSAQTINTGGVLVSNSYADATKVPTNGIYSKGEIVTETGRISAPSSAYHYIDLGRDGADRQIFGSYGAVYYFRNTVNDADVVTINNGSISCVGSITAAGNVTAYSDERIKEDVTVIENALTKVEQLNGVTFKRKDTLDRQTGLLAQEVEAVLPEAVTRQEASEEIKAITGDEEVLAVNYGALTGLLVESIKELSGKLKAQQELIDKQTKLIKNLLHKVSHS
ncbi:tail fiber domain-containing protein, partial [Acinetobacter baumannii]